MLESHTALRIKSNPCDGGVYCLRGAVNATHARSRELSGKEEHAVSAAAADLKHAFRIRSDMEHGGGQRRQGRLAPG